MSNPPRITGTFEARKRSYHFSSSMGDLRCCEWDNENSREHQETNLAFHYIRLTLTSDLGKSLNLLIHVCDCCGTLEGEQGHARANGEVTELREH